MTSRVLALLLVATASLSACAVSPFDLDSSVSADSTCGAANAACCDSGPGPRCRDGLGCSAGVCKDVEADMVAYAEYCKEQLGFANPRAKMAFVSCFDAQGADGQRHDTGRQAQLSLTRSVGAGLATFKLASNGPLVHDGHDVWDLMFGAAGGDAPAEGCDDPNYLYGQCDPYYRLNVFAPDPGNPDITAALHCRSHETTKPKPSTAIQAADRKRAFTDAPSSTPVEERTRLFDQWNETSEIVMTMTNLRTGKACFFHARSPYFGSHVPAPDDETDLSTQGAVDRVWDSLPVKPSYGKDDASRRSEWLRNGGSAWQRPDYMRCVGCHDSGPFMHDPFIDSMRDPSGADYLPRDKTSRPYLPLGYQNRTPKVFLKTGAVRDASGELTPQRCTSCHSMGTENECGNWFDRAVGWGFGYEASAASHTVESLKRYMPFQHGMTSSADYYAELGPHLDAMRCCCEHPSWRGCKTVPAATPQASGIEGTDARSCTDPTCGGRGQSCCGSDVSELASWGGCNHSGLQCVSGTCKFADE